MNNQTGFTLLELVIALAIFALLGLASWTLFDGVLRVQRSSMAHEREFRSLQRAVAVIERDLLHVTSQPIVLEQTLLRLERANWRNPLDQPRSERQALTYRLEGGAQGSGGHGQLWHGVTGVGQKKRGIGCCQKPLPRFHYPEIKSINKPFRNRKGSCNP